MSQIISSKIKQGWHEAGNTPLKRLRWISGTIIIFIIIGVLPFFFRYIEKRQGAVLHDWVLEQIPPHNVSVLIFIIIWGTGALILYRAIYKPDIYITYCWALIFVCLLRMTSIFFIELDPPTGLIPLADPLTGIFYGQAIITKDLFFSGHISTITLMFLCLEKRSDKTIAFCSIVVVAALLLVQHIHYTVDILAAPIITYACYWFTRRFMI